MRAATALVEIERVVAYYENIPVESRTEESRTALLDEVSAIRIREHHEWVASQRRIQSDDAREQSTGGAGAHGHGRLK